MSLQSIINSAQSIEFARGQLAATTMSRSGRLITSARNWVKPWQFTIVPKPVWRFADSRGIIETIISYDRVTEHTISLANNAGMTWMVEKQGAGVVGSTGFVVDNTTNLNSSNLVLRLGNANIGWSAGTVLLKAGDIIQPLGHRYPYVVSSDVLMPSGSVNSATKVTVILNRTLLPQDSYTFPDKTLVAGADCTWRVKVTKLPQVKYMARDFVEFTSDFEATEVVLGVTA